jgi:hypothetical protein
MERNIYKQEYTNCWALIIGINKYRYVSPLYYARNDAEVIASLLVEKFNFPKENVFTLLDEDATKNNILNSYMKFAMDDVLPDDKILIFFAGHGHTIRGNRNDVGYLVPTDGTTNNLSSLIRWDELTRNSELISAKHIFYIMDACFSGLAITRGLQQGSMRYLKDMLQRYSRQVLTAGKANEVVADANGPISEHSIFTGYLIQALDGEAIINNGILSANNVMAYVFENVSKDYYSNQTPHYGYFEGDGDFIFEAPILEELTKDENIDNDILMEFFIKRQDNFETHFDLIDQVKEYISEERFKLKLDTLATKELRQMLELTGENKMSIDAPFNNENMIERIKLYEKVTNNIQIIVASLAHWGSSNYMPILMKILSRSTDNITLKSGITIWLYLRWYPALLLTYIGGISAIAAENYENLFKIFTTRTESSKTNDKHTVLIMSVVESVLELDKVNVFKSMPGHERHYVPRSEYLFKQLQPLLDDILFLGKSYENTFDRFEVFYALVYADISTTGTNNIWGPPGRFAWKYRDYNRENNAFIELVKEAENYKDEWKPLKAGLFAGKYERFNQVASEYQNKILNNLNWY